MKPCLTCGEPSPDSYCSEHDRDRTFDVKASSTTRGYDTTWRKLSERARRLQPWCSDCFTTEDLTTDHSERAWQRKAEGKPIRLRDVDVVCRSCNGKRGRARPRGEHPTEALADPRAKAQRPLLSVPLHYEPEQETRGNCTADESSDAVAHVVEQGIEPNDALRRDYSFSAVSEAQCHVDDNRSDYKAHESGKQSERYTHCIPLDMTIDAKRTLS